VPQSARAFNELRPVTFELDYVIHPEGSVLITVGNTRVLCNATVQETLPGWLKYSNKRHGWVTAEYAMLPRSTPVRNARETLTPKGRTQEIQRLIGRSLRGAVDLNKLGERQIIIDCDVLQADGGTRTATITGGYVALALALKQLEKQKLISANVLLHSIAAVSVGIVGGQVMLDLDYEMDLAADVDMNVVMTGDGRFVEVQGTAEKQPFQPTALQEMLDLATNGIKQLQAMQAEALARTTR
jgi:ribonuclease PH